MPSRIRKVLRHMVLLLALSVVLLALVSCQSDDASTELAASVQSVEAGVSRIPAEIARLSLVDGQTALRDFRMDEAQGIAYVTDSAYTLHVVSLEPLEELGRFETSGELLTLDSANSRLYIAPNDPAPGTEAAVTVFDTESRAVIWSVPGARVAVDSGRNRYYVGDRPDINALATGEESASQGVRLFDGATQQLLVQGEITGAPVFNAARDELIVYNHSAFTVDPQTLAVRSDLFPSISAESLPGCTGCRYVRTVWMLGSRGPVAFDLATFSAGAGSGVEEGALLYDAPTMTPSDDRRSVGSTCSSQPVLIDAIDNGFLHHDGYSRYEVYNNLTVFGVDGSTLAFRDGLGSAFVNPNTGAAYIASGTSGNWIVDARTLAPLGVTAGWCAWQTGAGGLVYAADATRQALIALADSGGTSLLPVAEPLAADGLVGKRIKQIVLSPDFEQDFTLFLVVSPTRGTGDQVLRSVDAGASWTVIGGIPVGADLALTLAISPDFAEDGTLFLGGARSTYAGEGVWRSRDRGDTWTPVWNGLAHLRVNMLEISPDYATDGTVTAHSDYVRIDPWESGTSLHRSTDGGESWQRVSAEEEVVAAQSALLPDGTTAPVRKQSYAEPIEVLDASGVWSPALDALGSNQTLRTVLVSPTYVRDGAVYVVTDLAVYRSTDGGVTWQQLLDERVTSLTWENLLTAATLTPELADGSYRLLLGTASGAIWQEDPAKLFWGTPGEAPMVVSPLPTPDATPAPVATATLPTAQSGSAEPSPTYIAESMVVAEPTAAPTVAAQPTATTADVLPTRAVEVTPAQTTESTATGGYTPEGLWGSRWAGDAELQSALGKALTREPESVSAAYQFFEKGTMVWLADTGKIYIILNTGVWQAYEDTFKEDEMERDPNIYTPGELLQPERGFGKVWREHEELIDTIGWARAEEQGVTAQVQRFQKGFAMRLSGLEFILTGAGDAGTWGN